MGYAQTAYDIFGMLSFAVVFAWNLFYSSKYNITKKQSVIISAWILFTTIVWVYVISWAETGFQSLGGKNFVRGLIYIPLFAYPAACFFKIDLKRMCDFLAVWPPLYLAVTKIGCTFAGCCHGYPCEFGIYNSRLDQTAFPCQPLETMVCFLISAAVFYYSKRKNYQTEGLAFPLMLMLFGTARFLVEFLRDNRKIVFGCSPLALHALFIAVAGCTAYIYIYIYRRKSRRLLRNKGK